MLSPPPNLTGCRLTPSWNGRLHVPVFCQEEDAWGLPSCAEGSGQDGQLTNDEDSYRAASVATTHESRTSVGGSQSPGQLSSSARCDSAEIGHAGDDADALKEHEEQEPEAELARVFPRRKRGEAIRATDKPVLLTSEMLSTHFGKTLKEAAKALGLCPTALKSVCRKLGIHRWPYKTLRRPASSGQSVSAPDEQTERAHHAAGMSAEVTPVIERPEIVPYMGEHGMMQRARGMWRGMDDRGGVERPRSQDMGGHNACTEQDLLRSATIVDGFSWERLAMYHASLFPSRHAPSWTNGYGNDCSACDMGFLAADFLPTPDSCREVGLGYRGMCM
jgi:hypothetical protein